MNLLIRSHLSDLSEFFFKLFKIFTFDFKFFDFFFRLFSDLFEVFSLLQLHLLNLFWFFRHEFVDDVV